MYLDNNNNKKNVAYNQFSENKQENSLVNMYSANDGDKNLDLTGL